MRSIPPSGSVCRGRPPVARHGGPVRHNLRTIIRRHIARAARARTWRLQPVNAARMSVMSQNRDASEHREHHVARARGHVHTLVRPTGYTAQAGGVVFMQVCAWYVPPARTCTDDAGGKKHGPNRPGGGCGVTVLAAAAHCEPRSQAACALSLTSLTSRTTLSSRGRATLGSAPQPLSEQIDRGVTSVA